MEGFLIVDKPGGVTSHDVVGMTRRALGLRRVGHAGTLDPLATGVLVVGVGRATRLIEYVVGRPKTYTTTVRLGQATNTYDADGEVTIERDVPTLSEEMLREALIPFTGDIKQIPPMYSAIKKDGQPLYKLARKGIEIERPPRPVTIYGLELMGWDGRDVQLQVDCSTGTYIRSLAHDLGDALGCGGHVTVLRRTRVGAFDVKDAVEVDGIVADGLLPADVAVAHLGRGDVDEEQARDLGHGKVIRCDGLRIVTTEAQRAHSFSLREGAKAQKAQEEEKELVRVYAPDGGFLGILERRGDFWKPRKLFV